MMNALLGACVWQLCALRWLSLSTSAWVDSLGCLLSLILVGCIRIVRNNCLQRLTKKTVANAFHSYYSNNNQQVLIMTYAYVRFSNLPQDTPSSLRFDSNLAYASLQAKMEAVHPDKVHACVLTAAVEIEPGSNLFYIRNKGYRTLTAIKRATASTIRNIMDTYADRYKHLTHICFVDHIMFLLQQEPELSNIEPISITLLTQNNQKNVETYIDLYRPMQAPKRTVMDYLWSKSFVPELPVHSTTPIDLIQQGPSAPNVGVIAHSTKTPATQPNSPTGVLPTSNAASNASQAYASTTTSSQASGSSLETTPSSSESATTPSQASSSVLATTTLQAKRKPSPRPIQTIRFNQKKLFYRQRFLQETYDKRPYTTVLVCSVCIALMACYSTVLLSLYLKAHIATKWLIFSLACTLPIQMLVLWLGYQATRQPVVFFPSISQFHNDCLTSKYLKPYTHTPSASSSRQSLQTPPFAEGGPEITAVSTTSMPAS